MCVAHITVSGRCFRVNTLRTVAYQSWQLRLNAGRHVCWQLVGAGGRSIHGSGVRRSGDYPSSCPPLATPNAILNLNALAADGGLVETGQAWTWSLAAFVLSVPVLKRLAMPECENPLQLARREPTWRNRPLGEAGKGARRLTRQVTRRRRVGIPGRARRVGSSERCPRSGPEAGREESLDPVPAVPGRPVVVAQPGDELVVLDGHRDLVHGHAFRNVI